MTAVMTNIPAQGPSTIAASAPPNKWPDVLTPEQRENKLHNLLSGLRAKRRIERTGGFQDARWQLTSSDESGESAESSEN